LKNRKSQTGTFERVAECLYRYSTTGAYFALLKVNGVQTRVNLQTRDLATAKRKRDAEKDKSIRTDQDRRNCTLGEYVKTYLEGKSHLAFKTRHRYGRVLSALTRYEASGEVLLGDFRMGKVTTEILRRFHKNLGLSVSVRTSKEYLTVLKAFFRDAHADKVIGDNPALGLRETRKPECSIKAIPKLEQVQKIIATIRSERLSDTRHEAADFLTFLAGAGLGNAEAANLLVSHVDFEEGRIRVKRVKTSVEYFVPIYPAIRDLLVRRIKDKAPTDNVFAVKDIKKSLAAACRKLGFPNFTHRSFRKFFITRALDSGTDPRVVAALQGHADPKLVLKVYSEVSDEHLKREAAKVNFDLSQ
jgi:integrase